MKGNYRMKAVIMAGGKGTRLSTVLKDIPKPMVDLAGRPLLEHQKLKREWHYGHYIGNRLFGKCYTRLF